MCAGRRTLTDDDVELVILERRVQQFLKRGLQPVNFVNEQNLFRADIRQNGGEVSLDLQRWTRSLLKGHAQFVGNNCRQCRFAKARGAVQQNVVESFAPGAGGLDGDGEVFFDFSLSDELGETLRAQL